MNEKLIGIIKRPLYEGDPIVVDGLKYRVREVAEEMTPGGRWRLLLSLAPKRKPTHVLTLMGMGAAQLGWDRRVGVWRADGDLEELR